MPIIADEIYEHFVSDCYTGLVTGSRAYMLQQWSFMGSIPGCVIPKTLKIVPVASMLGAQHYKASTGSCLSYNDNNVYPHLIKADES